MIFSYPVIAQDIDAENLLKQRAEKAAILQMKLQQLEVVRRELLLREGVDGKIDTKISQDSKDSNDKIDSFQELLQTIRKHQRESNEIPENEQVNMILNNMKDTQFNKFVSPPSILIKNLVRIMVRIARDPRSTDGLISIAEDRKKMKYYGIVAIGILFFGFILNNIGQKELGFFARIRRKFFLMGFIFTCQVVAVSYFYGKEFSPILKIVKNTIFA